MRRPSRRLPFRPRRPRPEAGVTLVELLVALLISSVFVPLIWTTILSSIRYFEATVWQVQVERDLDRLTTLLGSEAEETCLFGTSADPGACVPVVNFACDTTPGDQLRMRVTLLDANSAPAGTRVIRYALQNGQLLRTGPAILPNGQLDPDTDLNDQLVMSGVTAFAVTPNNDCNTVAIDVTVNPVDAESSAPGVVAVQRAIGLRAGSRSFVD